MITQTIVAIALGLAGAANQPTVIGKPFRISDSVKEYCEAAPKIMMCEQTEPLLAAMLAETRDPRWAAPMEALIAKSMRVGGKDWVQIRALKYAVYLDDLDHDLDGSEDLEQLMEPLGGIVAPEMNQGLGKPMMVSVLVWQKRSAPPMRD